MADVFGREISFPKSYESSCWGAALLGMKALGYVDSLEAAETMTEIAIRHQPDKENARVYGELSGVFSRLYDRLEPEFSTMAELQRSMEHGKD
jgi:gluconokinase